MLKIAELLNAMVMYPIFKIPFVVLLTVLCAIFLTIRFRAVNLYGLFVNRKHRKHKMKKGELSGFAAFMSAAGATLGMGNIVGGAVAVTVGGVGSLFWIIIFSFFFSAIKFSETLLGHKYRKEDKDGVISGGAFFYIKKGFSELSFPKGAKFIASFYAVTFAIAYVFAAGFQLNQISSLIDVQMLKPQGISDGNIIAAIIIGIFVLFVLFGGIKRIGNLSVKLVPFMVIGHLFCSGYVIMTHFSFLDDVFINVMQNAFGLDGATGGMFFVMAYALQRMLFGSDSGTGASAIANSNSNKSSFDQALIVAMEPMLVALMMVLSGLVVILTKSHITANEVGLSGIHVVNQAFSQGGTFVLAVFWINITLFALTTIIGDGYYVEKSCYFLTNGKYIPLVRLLYIAICICCVVFPFHVIMPITDAAFFLSMAINVVSMLFLSKLIVKDAKIEHKTSHT